MYYNYENENENIVSGKDNVPSAEGANDIELTPEEFEDMEIPAAASEENTNPYFEP